MVVMAGQWHHSFLADFADVQALNECGDAQQRVQDLGAHGPIAGGQGAKDRLSARRMHKADREKLRRDKLNEQFSELANALDPDRPKNDKATILGESIQVVKDLREEVKRLKTEHVSLLDESADLTQEKNELREEKVTLKNETEQLQSQLQQRLCSSSPWMALDPSLVMGAAAAYPFPIPVPQPVSHAQSNSHQLGGPRVPPLVSPTSYMPIAPPLGMFHMHPTLQPLAMFGNRAGDGGNPYMPFPTFPPPVTPHSHIERPYAQYPSSVQQPVPGYAVQIQPNQGSQTPPTSGSPVYRPCVPGIPVIPAQNHALGQISKDSSDHSPTSQSSSPHAPVESEQENVGIVAAEVSQSPVLEDTTEAAAQDPEVKEAILELHEGSIASPPSIVSSTLSVKEKLGFSLDRSGLSLITEEHGKDSAGIRPCSQSESENVHDPTLRPPAA